MKLKNYLLVLLSLFFCQAAFAQTDKGNFALSGKTDLNFLFSNTVMSTDSIETGKLKNNQFGFTAAAGYFVIDNLNIGISGTYSYNYSKAAISQTITEAFTIMPQANYYFPVAGKLKPFIGIGAGYLWLRERDSRITDQNNEVYFLDGTAFSAGAGLSYFISKQVAFDLGFEYSHNSLKNKLNKSQVQKQNAVAGNLGISVFL